MAFIFCFQVELMLVLLDCNAWHVLVKTSFHLIIIYGGQRFFLGKGMHF